jgi:adenylate cyclase class IV
VRKHREIFLYANVRIHLDRVEDAGDFLEFEAVLASPSDSAEGHARIDWLREQFGVAAEDLVATSYGD